MRISDWSSDVCSSDLLKTSLSGSYHAFDFRKYATRYLAAFTYRFNRRFDLRALHTRLLVAAATCVPQPQRVIRSAEHHRSEEHTSELQSLMRISYAVFCLKKKTTNTHNKQ